MLHNHSVATFDHPAMTGECNQGTLSTDQCNDVELEILVAASEAAAHDDMRSPAVCILDSMSSQQPATIFIENRTDLSGDSAIECDDFFDTVKLGKTLLKEARGGCLDQALQCYRAALSCKYKTIHSEPAAVQSAFADILFDISTVDAIALRDSEMRIEALHLCLDLRRVCLGSSHLAVAEVLFKLASVYVELTEYQYAHELLVEALSILLNAENTASEVKAVWTALGHVQVKLGLLSDADSSFREAKALA